MEELVVYYDRKENAKQYERKLILMIILNNTR